jgi:hypothetical protein
MMDKPAVRKQYGAFNYSEAGAPDRWSAWEDSMRSGASEFNVGKVYEIPSEQRGGVRPGDNGILYHAGQFMGVLRATFAPSGVSGKLAYTDQWSGSPQAYQGDTPLDLQAQIKRPAPWRKGFN